MLRNTDSSTPTDTLPIEYVKPPIDWNELMLPVIEWLPDMTIENVFIAGICLLCIPIIFWEYKDNKGFCDDEDL